ncbi:MAG: ClC family H(+)/Cl(-) exchange transporter, partial [Methanobacteriaceae archaeon]|nr:ClC family H(+)/Cl(-) exchange transporter [Methanobacteriaceae archaeon]
MKIMNKNYGAILKNSKYINLIIEGILIGLASGFIVSLYRFALTKSENIFFGVISFIIGDLILTILWFIILGIMGVITGILIKWEPI